MTVAIINITSDYLAHSESLAHRKKIWPENIKLWSINRQQLITILIISNRRYWCIQLINITND